MDHTLKIAACQLAAGTDKAENLREIARLAALAASEGAELAVFPEYAMYHVRELSPAFVAQAETLDGPFVTELKRLAVQHGIALVAGMHERVAGNGNGNGNVEDEVSARAANTLVAIDPLGELLVVYRKQHLYDAFGIRESDFLCPGPTGEPVTFALHGVTVGLLTCYDLRFPEAARLHADAGVDVLVYPAAWVPGPRKEDHWNTLARARAIENTIYVAAVSQAPRGGTGGSVIVDPNGVVLGEVGEDVGAAVAAISHSRVAAVREFNPSLANRRYTVAPRD